MTPFATLTVQVMGHFSLRVSAKASALFVHARDPLNNRVNSAGSRFPNPIDRRRHRLAVFLQARQIPGHCVLDIGQGLRAGFAS